MIIEKDTTPYGHLIAVETFAHFQFYQYRYDSRVRDGHEDVDGEILLEGHNPIVFVEARGHGIYAWDGNEFPGGTGVVYRFIPERGAEEPDGRNDRDVSYDLISILDELWIRRFDMGDGNTFDSPFQYQGYRFSSEEIIGATLDGDNYTPDAAHNPWHLDDWDDGEVYAGDMFFDPAYTFSYHLFIPGQVSLDYIYNPYLGIFPPTPTPTQAVTPTNTPISPTITPTESSSPTSTPIIPTITMTPTPPLHTPTNIIPTYSPVNSPTPSKTFTPTLTPTNQVVTPSPTQSIYSININLSINKNIFHPGERFLLKLYWKSFDISTYVDLYIILDVYGNYYFYPSWTQDIDYYSFFINNYTESNLNILDFIFPENCGSAQGIKFWAGITYHLTFEILSNIDSVEFGFSE